MADEVTFLFADLSGYTALTEAHGDAGAADVACRLYDLARASLTGGARLIKTIGDAVMVAALDPFDALRTALSLIAATRGEPLFPLLHLGLHRGHAIERDGDFFGAAVNVAARVAAQARSGQVLLTAALAATAREHGLPARPLGAVHLKNIVEPVDLYALEVASGLEIDPVCRMAIGADATGGPVDLGGHTYHFCSRACAEKFVASPASYVMLPVTPGR